MGVKVHGQALNVPKKVTPATDYGSHLESKPAMGTIQKTTKTPSGPMETSTTEMVNPGLMATKGTMGEIYVEGGRTINLGDYNSARITVGLRMPCSMDSLQEAYEFAQEWVSSRIDESMK